MDELYERLLMTNIFYRIGCGILDWADRAIVDGIVDLVGWFNRNIGRALAILQTGQLQVYGVAITAGIAVMVTIYLFWG
jgi:NADH:ubiquinone oxidoreductase subunit 5 (subunit L)/multisubunit Na+/H+ antiporter MnhA subunit